MRISKMNRLHPALELKRENLQLALEKRMDQMLSDVENPTKTPEELADELHDWLLELLDEALWPGHQNILTIGAGDDDEVSYPYFPN